MARNVLLVEDDRAIATVIIAALEDEGFEITHCASIRQRDAALAGDSCGVMLTDVMLEDGDGLATLTPVREIAPDMPVLLDHGLRVGISARPFTRIRFCASKSMNSSPIFEVSAMFPADR